MVEKKLTHLYMITNKINNKLYFGITSQNPVNRWTGHKTVAKRMIRNTPLYRSMRLHGFENFIFEVIDSSNDRDYIANLEIEHIKKFNTQDRAFGYNLSDGGEINIGYKIPLEIVARQKDRMKGENNHFYGRHHTEESREKISKAKLGRKLSEETRLKMKGRISPMKGIKGEENHLYGVERPEHVKKAIQLNTPHRKEVLMIEGDIVMKFLSKKSAGQWLIDNGKCSNKNVRSVTSSITRAIAIKSESYGYKWEEVNERQSTIETTQ